MKCVKNLIFCAICLCVFVSTAASADINLPKPLKSGGMGVFSAIENRASGTRGAFPAGAISDEELSTILWAAAGKNRNGDGWTVPTAGGLSPYAVVYVVMKDSAYLYDPEANKLIGVTNGNVINNVTNDNFVKKAPVVLVFVSSTDSLGAMGKLNEGNALAYNITGAMAQNAYLACESLKISARYMVSMNADGVNKVLKLKKGHIPVAILPLGKR
ncbi:nitroreductase [Synergistales bacterium]|nr:nitroreductase [Synergistales bacterium]